MDSVPDDMDVINISDRLSKSENGKTNTHVALVVEIGACSGCMKHTKLEEGACASCRSKFGKKCGVLFSRVRKSEEFAQRFYNVLVPKKQRAFIMLFGLPRGCLAPGETHDPSPRPRLRVVQPESPSVSPDQDTSG